MTLTISLKPGDAAGAVAVPEALADVVAADTQRPKMLEKLRGLRLITHHSLQSAMRSNLTNIL